MSAAASSAARLGPVLDGVRAVLLDIDDTLIDTRAAFGTAIDAVAEVYLPHLTTAEVAQALEIWRADAQGFYRRHTAGELSAVEQRRLRAAEVHERFGGPPVDAALFEDWNAIFREGFAAGWRVHDDVVPLLDALDAAGVPFGALTNAPLALSRDKFARTGLGERVAILVTLDTFGVGKPDPRLFREACRLLGTEPGETVYVGDELDVDGVGARRAGLRGVWLDRPGVRRGGVHLEDPAVAREAGVDVVTSLRGLLGE
ncbi:HAD family hydrolase [Litorihabitans aurantiacus]|uniref:Haloacid dehalogenase n=1 Tax=Litorihabitans aurantiacus TaxID=1930061 RepID=A0AA37UHN3_9MICO|nr:HAD family hydrolase [Litorihabitans aurantiacus]GMA30804.1 haloacid dehalogenase [Litorihabitans aurantiacus]